MSYGDILTFWLAEVGEKGWFEVNENLDKTIRDPFYVSWIELCAGSFGLWSTYPSGAVGYILHADQFSRNMFRGHGNEFASDRMGIAAAKSSLKRGWDLRIDEPVRQFFYLPLMHSENLSDQDRCVRLVLKRMPQMGVQTLSHAKADRDIICQFGRFPCRNDGLHRPKTQAECEYHIDGAIISRCRSF